MQARREEWLGGDRGEEVEVAVGRVCGVASTADGVCGIHEEREKRAEQV